MTSKAEMLASLHLRALLCSHATGAVIEEDAALQELASDLEFLLPEVLAGSHEWWKSESLDGVVPSAAWKRGPDELELVGACILINDQTLTPVWAHLRASPVPDELDLISCKIGEVGSGSGGMVRIPYSSAHLCKLLRSIELRIRDIRWAYSARRRRPRRE